MSRLAFGVAAAAGVLFLFTAAPALPAAAGPEADLVGTVSAKALESARGVRTLASAGPEDTRVTVARRSGADWAFGTAVVVAPHVAGAYPQGHLFLARRAGGGWQVAFRGEPAFADLAAGAPVLSEVERAAFRSQPGTLAANGDYRTYMRLPFAVGQTWSLSGGPHGWSGYNTPWSSIDLSGGDQRVLATRAGTAYTMCRGWLRVVHGNGYETDYYHLWNNISVNGAWVNEGAFLGYTGTDVTCGGSAVGRHVHFALRQNGGYVGIAYHGIGKWVFMNGGSAYQGYALHGSARVNVGGGLYNYGRLEMNQGIVDANGGGSVNKRSGPGTGYPVVASVADGATLTISCSANGTTHTGRWGTTSLWNRLTDGTWVSDAFVWTGASFPVNGWC